MRTAVGAPAPRPSIEEMLEAISQLDLRSLRYVVRALAVMSGPRHSMHFDVQDQFHREYEQCVVCGHWDTPDGRTIWSDEEGWHWVPGPQQPQHRGVACFWVDRGEHIPGSFH